MSKSDSENSLGLSRRQALLSATAGVAAVAATASSSDVATVKAAGASCSTPRSAVAKTQYGKVRGYVEDGVLTFKGVPYGANTGGENRWLPATPPAPWDGEYPALTYGANCPQRLVPYHQPLADSQTIADRQERPPLPQRPLRRPSRRRRDARRWARSRSSTKVR